MNTHYAVIAGSVPPSLDVIACGPREFCEESLTKWLERHPLGKYETAEILTRDPETVNAEVGVPALPSRRPE